MISHNDPVSVEFLNTSKRYGNGPKVLDNLNLKIEAGELVTVLGPSGSGKSTTIRLLAGFEPLSEGEILVNGSSILNTPPNQRNMGMVFQAYSLFPNLTVEENIEYGMAVRKVNKAARRRRSEELLEMTGLPGLGQRFPHQLSGGQQQRVALARALAIEPQVLLLDEPLSALDATVRSNLREEIRRIQLSSGVTTIFITHDQAEALVMADRVAVMNAGKVEQFSDPRTLYENPQTLFSARFIGEINEFAVARNWHSTEPLPLDQGESQTQRVLFIRPEHLKISPDENSHALVKAHQYMGERTMVFVEHPQARLGHWKISVSAREAAEVPVGTRVAVQLQGEIALDLPSGEVKQ